MTPSPLPADGKGADVEEIVSAAWPLEKWRDLNVLVAVSGGPDSVALLRALLSIRQSSTGILAAHFNHRLRGADSDGDEEFVRVLCQRLSVPLHVASWERDHSAIASSHHGEGLEGLARSARYQFLQRVAEESGCRHVVTGHTLDDQVETILHRVIRGTGLRGLAGIPFVRSLGPALTLVRPLLKASRADVLAYLSKLGQVFCVDDSNAAEQYTRNKLRHRLLPLLRDEFNPGVAEALARLGHLAAEFTQFVDESVAPLLELVRIGTDQESLELNCREFGSTNRFLIRETLIRAWERANWPAGQMGFSDWDRLADLALAPLDARHMFPGGILAEKQGHHLRLTRPSSPSG
jgi:tRNA(Ile)-lysidine synthase